MHALDPIDSNCDTRYKEDEPIIFDMNTENPAKTPSLTDNYWRSSLEHLPTEFWSCPYRSHQRHALSVFSLCNTHKRPLNWFICFPPVFCSAFVSPDSFDAFCAMRLREVLESQTTRCNVCEYRTDLVPMPMAAAALPRSIQSSRRTQVRASPREGAHVLRAKHRAGAP